MTEEPTTRESALCVQLAERIKRSEDFFSPRVEQLRKWRRYLQGQVGDDQLSDSEGAPKLVRANLVYATIHGLLQHIYARRPEVAVTPVERVQQPGQQTQQPALRGFAKTLELVVNRQLKDGGLKPSGKLAVIAALGGGLGWTKLTYQRDLWRDPHIVNRMQDVQDELMRLGDLQRREGTDEDPEARAEELKNLLAALEAKVEVALSEGLVLDALAFEDVRFDPGLRDFRRLPQAGWVAERIWMPRDVARERFGRELTQARCFSPRKGAWDHADEDPQKTDAEEPVVAVWELWDRTTMSVYTLAEGEKDFLRPPFQPARVGQRWFPYFPLSLYPVDGRLWPLSLTEQLQELGDEYNAIRTQMAEHRAISLPHWVADKTTDRETLSRYTDAVLGEVVILDAQGRPLKEVIQVIEPPPYNPAIYDTAPVRFDFDAISGLQDAARGAVARAKTATEAEIMQQGLSSRVGEMQDTIEDWLSDIAQYAAEVLLQELSPDQVQKIAGPHAVWPSLTKEQVFDMVEIGIRAGSSGNPDQRREQETWVTLLPVLQQLIGLVVQGQMQGMDVQPMVALLRETLRRFDERLELEEFLPGLAQMQGLPPQAMAQVQALQQQLMQAQQALQETGARLQQAEAAAADKEQDRALKREEMSMRSRESSAKADADREKTILDAILKTVPLLQAKRENEARTEQEGQQNAQLTQVVSQTQGAVASALEELAEALERIAEAQAAPRSIVRDEQGRPSGVVVAPQNRNLQ